MKKRLKEIRKSMESAKKTHSVVKMMKAFSSSKIHEFRSSSDSLALYQEVIGYNFRILALQGGLPGSPRGEGGLHDCFLIGSDQGMVGRFNDCLFEYMMDVLSPQKGSKLTSVGKKIASRIPEEFRGESFPAPLSVGWIPHLIGELLDEIDQRQEEGVSHLYVFYNRPLKKGRYEPVHRQLLPFSAELLGAYLESSWETRQLPQQIGETSAMLAREFLYISLFQMCSDSLVAEHSTRLASMQEAERNIERLLEEMEHSYNKARQNEIDAELFDILSGFEALEHEEG